MTIWFVVELSVEPGEMDRITSVLHMFLSIYEVVNYHFRFELLQTRSPDHWSQ